MRRREKVLSGFTNSQYWFGRWDENVDDLYIQRLYDYDGPLSELVYLLPTDRRLIIVQTGIYGFDLPSPSRSTKSDPNQPWTKG